MTGPIPDFYADPLYKGTSADFLEHHVCLNESGVGLTPIKWCRENCQGEWGWFFKPGHTYDNPGRRNHSTAYMSFSNTQDAIKFKLIMI